MRVKPYLLASAMALCLTAGAIHHQKAFAAGDNAMQAAPIIVAQNDDSNRSFLGRIFNRRDDSSGAKPLYMNKGTSGQAKPYDFSRNRTAASQRRRNTGNVSWEAFEDARAKHAREIQEYAQAASDAVVAASMREIEQLRAAEARGDVSGAGAAGSRSSSNKKMVYDPAKAWTYNPNKPEKESVSERPRIYNASP